MNDSTTDTTSTIQPTPTTAHIAVKPLMRGYLHAFAAIAAIIGTILLCLLTYRDLPKMLSLLIYGLCSIFLFAWSATYHIGTWSVEHRAFLRRVDHTNIFIMIAGTYTPIVFNIMTGWWRIIILSLIWILAVLGILLTLVIIPRLHLSRRISAIMYVAMGWVVIAAIPEIIARVGIRGLLLLILAGVLYTLGAIAYALRKPTLWSRVFSYHEVFHLATILANGAFFAFMWFYVVPFVRS